MRKIVIALIGLLVITSSAQAPTGPFVPETWNMSKRDNGDGSFTAQISQGFMNYLNENGVWEKIDLRPRSFNRQYVIDRAPFSLSIPEYANGEIQLVANNRFDIQRKEITKDPPITKTKRFPTALNVKGNATYNGVRYSNAFTDADLLIEAGKGEVRYLVQWHALPSACSNSGNTLAIPFEQTFDRGILKDRNGKLTNAERDISGMTIESGSRAIKTPPAIIWDNDGKSEPISLKVRYSQGILHGEKRVPCSFFSGATYPVTTDTTDTFNTTADTDIEHSNASYATAHDAADGTTDHETDATNSIQNALAGDYFIRRAFLMFDTSALPDTATISSATMSIFVTARSSVDADSIRMVTTTPASTTTFSVADYDQAGTTAQATDIVATTLSTSAFNAFTLNATGISNIALTGTSKFGIRFVRDVNNSAPTGQNAVTYQSLEGANDPKMDITYTIVDATFEPISISIY